MAITTKVVDHPKINGVYQVSDKDLKINGNNPDTQHDVVITSINRKRGTARVKTITSLEKRNRSSWAFKNHKLEDVRNGDILIIPKNKLRSRVLSGINHNSIEVSLKKIHYKEPYDRTMVPNRYKGLVKRK